MNFNNLAKIYFAAFCGVVLTLVLIFTGWFKPINDLFDHCWTGSASASTWLQKLRGNNYWVAATSSPKLRRYCLVTSWAITHVTLYAIIGFLFPTLFWPTFLVGVAYEIMEWIALDCHDILDLAWNSMGFFIGATLRGILSK